MEIKVLLARQFIIQARALEYDPNTLPDGVFLQTHIVPANRGDTGARRKNG